METRLYTLLKIKAEYGLSITEWLFWTLVEDTSHEDYIRNLIELRDAGYIHEDNNGDALSYRNRYLTDCGREYLQSVKRLYLNELWIKNRWKVIGVIASALIASITQLMFS